MIKVIYALKGQLIIAQGNTLGTGMGVGLRPERAAQMWAGKGSVALSGRRLPPRTFTQGVALGYYELPFQGADNLPYLYD